MSFSERETATERLGRRVEDASASVLHALGHKWTLPAAVVLLIGFAWYDAHTRPELDPFDNAPPFEWPKGCTEKAFRHPKNERVPCACFLEKHRIDDWSRRGMVKFGKGFDGFYRVGNSAVQLQLFGKRGERTCEIDHEYPDFFIVPKKPGEMSSGHIEYTHNNPAT